MDYPIHKVLKKPDLVRHVIRRSIKFFGYCIKYETRGPIKSQSLTKFAMSLCPSNSK